MLGSLSFFGFFSSLIIGVILFPDNQNILKHLHAKVLLPGVEDSEISQLLSAIKIVSGKAQLFNENEKNHLCASLERLMDSITPLTAVDYFHIFDSSSYLKCSKLVPDQERLLNSLKEKSTTPLLNYYLYRLSLLWNSPDSAGIFENIVKKSVNDLSISDKIYLTILMCSDQNKDENKLNTLLQGLMSDIFEGNAINQNIDDISHLAVFLLSLSKSKTFKLIGNDKLLNALNYIEDKFTFNSSQIGKLLLAFDILSKDESLYFVDLRTTKLNTFDTNKKNATIFIHNRFTNLPFVSHKITFTVNSVTCKNKQLQTKDYSVTISPNKVDLMINMEHDQCSVDMRFGTTDQSATVVNKKYHLSLISEKRFKLIDISVSISDSKDSGSNKVRSVSYNSSIQDLVKGDLIKFAMEFYVTTSNVRFQPHQVFLNLRHKIMGLLVTFIFQVDANNRYKCDFDIHSSADKSFYHLSGVYDMHLIVGDFGYSVLNWNMGEVNIKFVSPSTYPNRHYDLPMKPELHNYPKILYKMPYSIITLAFTLAIVGIGFSLIFMWKFVGFEVSMKFSLWRIIFYLSFLGYFYLCYCYWTCLNGFEAMRYFLPLSFIICLSLNYVLDIKTNI